MTNESKERFLAERVRALATVILTRRGDLTVVETKQDTGLDFHVYIDREDKPMRLTFGVLLRGVPSSVTVDHANKIVGPTMGQFQGMRKFTYPVCLFFFTMRDEQAYLGAPLDFGFGRSYRGRKGSETHGGPQMPTLTIEYRDESHRIALEQAIAYASSPESS